MSALQQPEASVRERPAFRAVNGGFIGGNLAPALHPDQRVTGLDNSSTGRERIPAALRAQRRD